MSNTILEWIIQVLGYLVRAINIQHTYVDKNDPWVGILASAVFEILSTTKRQKCYSTGQLIFGRDVILLIKHRVDCKLIRQQNRRKLIEITPAKIYIELTTTVKAVITSFSLNTLHKIMKRHKRSHLL